jgi:MOSC domain-containing protein YiiM
MLPKLGEAQYNSLGRTSIKGAIPMNKGTIYAISISPERGQLKTEVSEAKVIENFGIENDGHAGDWGRQVTCLNWASVQRTNQEHNLNAGPGEFAENILIDGLDFSSLSVGSRIRLGASVVLEVSQIGKEDHPSVVTRKFGVSLLPYEGLFCRVVQGGQIRKGDAAE